MSRFLTFWLANGGALGPGVLAILLILDEPWKWLGLVWLAFTLILDRKVRGGLAKSATDILKLRLHEQQIATIQQALDAFCEAMHFNKACNTRCTIWRRTEADNYLSRLIPDYRPGGEAAQSFDRLHTSKGIVGLAFRSKKAHVWLVPEVVTVNAAFQELMVTKWGFTEKEAKRLPQDRRSFLAIPMFTPQGGQNVVAVLYCDSNDRFQPTVVDTAAGYVPFLEHLLTLAKET